MDELIVGDFLESWPRNESDLAVIKKRAFSNAMYKNLLLSEDGRFTTVVIQTHSHSTLGQQIDVLEGFEDTTSKSRAANSSDQQGKMYLTDAENSEAVSAVKKIVAEFDTPDFRIYVAGSPAVTHFLKRALMGDMRKFMGLATATVAIFLFLMFRRITGVVFPLFIVLLSLLSTVGIMALTGTAIKLPTQILPSFLLAALLALTPIRNTQFAAALNGIFTGWDISFYFADIYAQTGFLPFTATPSVPQSKIKHPRIKMLGGAFDIARGNWLLKAEAAFFDGFEFTNTPGKKYSRLDALAGAEYSGISDATITLEIANRHLFDFKKRLENSPDFQKDDVFEWAVRITKPFWNDTLNLTFLSTIFGPTGENGGFQRFTARYDWTDSIELTGGVVFYQSGSLRRTRGIGRNDRVYFEVQYNF